MDDLDPGPVLVGPFPEPVCAALESDLEFTGLLGVGGVRFTSHPVGSPEFAADLRDVRVLLGVGPYPPESWEGASRLRLVSVAATGYRTFVDVAATRRRGIDIAYVPAYGAESIAEHALGLVLALAKNIVPADAAMRGGGWRGTEQSMQLSGGVAGVIGLGPIGTRMVRLLEALGMDVLVCTRSQDPGRLAGTSARYATLEEAVTGVDVVSLHVALTPQTTGMIDADLLRRARPGTIVVNTARAELIAQGALEKQVLAGRIRAGLDVFRAEPPAADDPVRRLGERAVLTPHIAFNTQAASRSVVLGAARNVAAWIAGSPVNLAADDL